MPLCPAVLALIARCSDADLQKAVIDCRKALADDTRPDHAFVRLFREGLFAEMEG